MVKSKRKGIPSFKNINGDTLIVNIHRMNGCLKICVKNRSNSRSLKNGLFLGLLVCAIALLVNFYIGFTVTSLTIVIFLWYKLFFMTYEENLLLIKGLGYQISKEDILGKQTTFIPYEKVQTIFINEVIFRYKVIYLLTLLTKDGENMNKLIPLFMNTLPRLQCLEAIYNNVKSLENI